MEENQLMKKKALVNWFSCVFIVYVAIIWVLLTNKLTMVYLKMSYHLRKGLEYHKTLIFSLFEPKIS